MLRPASTAVCICIASLAVAETGSLSGKALTDLVSGSVVEIDTPLGTKIPVHYSENGRLSGHSKDLASYLGAAADNGRWWVANDQVCHKWDKWFKGELQCLRIEKRGSKVNWRNQEGTSGTATIISRMQATSGAMSSASPPTRADGIQPSSSQPARPPTVVASAAPMLEKLPQPMRLTPADALPAAAGRPLTPPSPTVKRPSVVSSAAASGLVSRTAASTSALPAAKAPVAGSGGEPATDHGKSVSTSADKARAPAGPLFKVANVDSSDVLNIRYGPSSETAAVGAIPSGGSSIEVTGECQSGWCPIRHREVMGWVNRSYLESEIEARERPEPAAFTHGYVGDGRRDPSFAQRTCLTPPARALIDRIEARFGSMKLVSTCRSGATVAGTGRPSKHASGNAIDFEAGPRKREVVDWLIASHHAGGVMTYADMEHIHVDIGPHFVALEASSGGGRRSARRWNRWASNG